MFDFQQKRGDLMISCEKLKKSPLFKGIEEEGIFAVLSCLAPSQKTYRKGQSIFRIGDSITDIGFILRGSVLVEKEDFWGNRSILVHLRESDIFGESFASLGAKALFNTVAAEDSEILFLSAGSALTCCSSACPFHHRLILNLLSVIAEKNTVMAGKIDVMSQRTVREKLLTYLSSQAQLHGSSSFEIPLNRQQLADYLAIDRSHMTVELGKLEKEGILRFRRNFFRLL